MLESGMMAVSKKIFERPVQSALFALGIRLVIYAILLGTLAIWMLWGAVRYDAGFYDETGPIEILETVFALSSAIIFLFAARSEPVRTGGSVLLAGTLFCVAVRESDYFLDVLVAHHAWKVIVTLIAVSMAVYSAGRIKEVYRSVLLFISRPCFGIFLSGALVLVVFSRLFGYGPFWNAIMDDCSYRTVKTIVEEGVEQMGYFLILISSVEYWYDARIGRKYAGREVSDQR
jgi:hypothetical protein